MKKQAWMAMVWAVGFCLSVSGARADNEAVAKEVTADLRMSVTEATAIIGDLQPAINGSKVTAAEVTSTAVHDAFLKRYEKAAGKPFDPNAAGLLGETRKAFAAALKDTMGRFEKDIVKGGQDAFVPAFFRAQLLARFNAGMKDKVQGYATNRDKELINSDWAVEKIMKGSPLIPEVRTLLDAGKFEPVVKRSGDRMMGYAPMKLGASCVACHARHGLKQTEGAFGGALITEVRIK